MSKEVPLQVFISEKLKYRLDRSVVEERTTLKGKVTELLDKHLPKYEE